MGIDCGVSHQPAGRSGTLEHGLGKEARVAGQFGGLCHEQHAESTRRLYQLLTV
ncbi:MAG: hypothetical protein ACREWG_05185 [Gammaproteobacteria bacterium]